LVLRKKVLGYTNNNKGFICHLN